MNFYIDDFNWKLEEYLKTDKLSSEQIKQLVFTLRMEDYARLAYLDEEFLHFRRKTPDDVVKECLSTVAGAEAAEDAELRQVIYEAYKSNPICQLDQRYTAWKNSLPKCLTLPPGEYIISDPCYIIPDDKWNEFLDKSFYNREVNEERTNADIEFERWGYADMEGKDGQLCRSVVFSTWLGDGIFPCKLSDGREFALPVDAGSIGLTNTKQELDEMHPNVVAGETVATQTIKSTSDIKLKYYRDRLEFVWADENGEYTGQVFFEWDVEDDDE